MSDKAKQSGGFTLIEVLVVIVILSALAALGVPRIIAMLRSGETKAVEAYLKTLEAQIDSYEKHPRNGDYPPTVLDGYPGVGALKNYENCGIESVVLCLGRKGMSGGSEFESGKKDVIRLENQDGDETVTQLTTYGNKALNELVDQWGTPLAYFHHRDYELVERRGWGTISAGEGSVVDAKPWKDSATGTWARPRSFQLISAGPDLEFNTDDDITNFSR